MTVAGHSEVGERLLCYWQRLHNLPGGKWLFSRLIGHKIPYSGSIRFLVSEFEPGRTAVTLSDYRGVRNHLKSIHAMALANLGEMSTGLAVISALPTGMRGILTHFKVDYEHKARGRLTATCDVRQDINPQHPPTTLPCDIHTTGQLRNEQNLIVATVTAVWRIDRH